MLFLLTIYYSSNQNGCCQFTTPALNRWWTFLFMRSLQTTTDTLNKSEQPAKSSQVILNEFCQFSLFYCAWPSAGPRLLKSLQKEIADVFGPPSLHFFSFPHFCFSASPGAAILNYLGVVVDGRGDCLLQQTACSGLLQGTNCGQKANINGKWLIAKS